MRNYFIENIPAVLYPANIYIFAAISPINYSRSINRFLLIAFLHRQNYKEFLIWQLGAPIVSS